MKLCGLTASLFFCSFVCFLQFVVSVFTSTQDLDSVHVVNKEEQQTRVYTVLYCHVITKKNKTKKPQTGLLSQNVTLIFHHRRQKRREEMPRFLVFVLLCNYEWEPLSMPTTLLRRHL